MMNMRPIDKEAVYGYRLRNFFNGEVIAERKFETREEMEAGLAEDLAPEKILGSVFKSLEGAQD